jgi:WhiB family redox-sensing transcriptional regulator
MTMKVKSAPTLREIADRSWMEQASCRGVDTEYWFLSKPPKYVRRHIERVCSSCPMTRLCLSYALVNNEEFGAWGGYMAHDLQPLRRRFASGETLSSLLNVGIPKAGLRQGSIAA